MLKYSIDGCKFLLSNDFLDTSCGCEEEGREKEEGKNRFEVGLIAEQIHGGR